MVLIRFSKQDHNLCLLSLAFIIDLRLVAGLIFLSSSDFLTIVRFLLRQMCVKTRKLFFRTPLSDPPPIKKYLGQQTMISVWMQILCTHAKLWEKATYLQEVFSAFFWQQKHRWKMGHLLPRFTLIHIDVLLGRDWVNVKGAKLGTYCTPLATTRTHLQL